MESCQTCGMCTILADGTMLCNLYDEIVWESYGCHEWLCDDEEDDEQQEAPVA